MRIKAATRNNIIFCYLSFCSGLEKVKPIGSHCNSQPLWEMPNLSMHIEVLTYSYEYIKYIQRYIYDKKQLSDWIPGCNCEIYSELRQIFLFASLHCTAHIFILQDQSFTNYCLWSERWIKAVVSGKFLGMLSFLLLK